MNLIKKYTVIYADHPWSYNDKGCKGNADSHYKTMSVNDICNLPIKEITDKNCVLFIWATYPMIKECLEVIKSWGFKYKTIGFQRVKQNKSGKGYFFGLGHRTHSNTECCLIGVKGKPHRVKNNISQLIFAPLREHSRKPDIVRDKIKELIGENQTYIELFARTHTEGRDVRGNETDKF